MTKLGDGRTDEILMMKLLIIRLQDTFCSSCDEALKDSEFNNDEGFVSVHNSLDNCSLKLSITFQDKYDEIIRLLKLGIEPLSP